MCMVWFMSNETNEYIVENFINHSGADATIMTTKEQFDTITEYLSKSTRLANHTMLLFGRHLIGPGPSRWGWAAFTAAGSGMYLGRTTDEAMETVLRVEGDDYPNDIQVIYADGSGE